MKSYKTENSTRFVRYLRQEGLVDQKKLEKTRVLIAGLGGLGHPVATYFALMGVKTLYLLDDDIVEESNLNRQFLFTEDDIGKKKTDVAEKKLKRLNPKVNLVKLSELNDKIKTDIVMDCFDNWTSRHELWDYALSNSLPVIHGAVDEFRGQIAVLFKKGDTASLKNKSESGCLVVGPTTGLIGSKMVLEALKVIRGEADSKLIVYDGKFEEFPIRPGKTPITRDFSKHKIIRLWKDPLKMEKGRKYLIVCKGGLKSARVAEGAKKKGYNAESMSYRSAKKRGLL